MENLKRKEEPGVMQETLPASVVITGVSEEKKLTEKFLASGNMVAFVHLEEDTDFKDKNFAFKDMHPAINFAQQHGYSLVIGMDHQYHRLSIAVRKSTNGPFQVLNAHQLAVLVTNEWISQYQTEELVIVKSRQVTDMVDKVADKERIACISRIIEPGNLPGVVEEISNSRNNAIVLGFTENQEFFENQGGFEGIVEKLVEMEKHLRNEDKTLFDKLLELYKQHGFYKEKTITVDFLNDSQKAHILKKMDEIRRNPSAIQERLNVVKVIDYKKGKAKNLISQNITSIDQSGYNILKLEMENGTSVTFAPAEDKMYYYVGMKEGFRDRESLSEVSRNFDEQAIRIMQIINKL